ncbi:FMN-dependent NADH-azoreductase [Pseudovibrio denitrificans]|uniref:FMN-dependent NADH-azoreductase n=1 Tax=Pseudovibrio denitrificans TaxID=258256 RepID=UPI0039BF741D
MPQLLYVSSSVRPDTSQSNKLGQIFCQYISELTPETTVVTRDVGINPPSHPDAAYTVANYTPPDERTPAMQSALAQSDMLIDELLSSDQLVFSVPMYNFSVPSTFKAYIDNLVRVGRTFIAAENGVFQGLLTGKKALFITARGAAYGEASPLKAFDHQEGYLRTVSGFMGLTDVQFVHADGLDFADKTYRDASLANAKKNLSEIATAW